LGSKQDDLARREAWEQSSERSRARRAARAAELRRRLRVRGGAASLAAVALATAAAGGGLALADSQTGGAEVRASHNEARERPVVLKLGSRGPTVAALQRRLGLPADGVYGRQTRAAVKRFQRRAGLTPDGVAGPATLRRLGIRPRARRDSASRSIGAILERIAQCESGGNPRAVSPDGRYRGKYQFTRETWESVGGSGDPADASEAEQDRRARILYRRAGAAPWGACGARATS
jgi:hypothetical protein